MSVQAGQPANSGQFGARTLSVAQACAALRVSRRTLYYWIKRGRLQTVRTSMGSQRVLAASVNPGWLERLEPRDDKQSDGFCTQACGELPTEE